MKNILVIIALFSNFTTYCQEDYVIRLKDTSISISLDKQYNIVVKGEKLNFFITQKDTLTYKNNLFSFKHPKTFKVSSTKLDDGIEQISILNSEGSGIIIQSYASLNPTSLNETMLNEITKESISYGFEQKKTAYNKILNSGHKIDITKAVLKYKDEVNIYEVASIGKKDEGILILTLRMDENDNTEGQNLINLMWESLRVNW